MAQVNCLVEMPDQQKRRRVLYINMLKKWHTPVSPNYLAQEEWGSSGPGTENEFSVGEGGRSVRIMLVG